VINPAYEISHSLKGKKNLKKGVLCAFKISYTFKRKKKRLIFFWRWKVYQIAGVETKILPRKNMSENKN
jgi:hypothetical protein